MNLKNVENARFQTKNNLARLFLWCYNGKGKPDVRSVADGWTGKPPAGGGAGEICFVWVVTGEANFLVFF